MAVLKVTTWFTKLHVHFHMDKGMLLATANAQFCYRTSCTAERDTVLPILSVCLSVHPSVRPMPVNEWTYRQTLSVLPQFLAYHFTEFQG